MPTSTACAETASIRPVRYERPSARTPCGGPCIASRKPPVSTGSPPKSSAHLPRVGLPWILDIDVTVKPLYGHQQGAEIGYNPQKPGRPSHVYHSYFVANLRISLGVEVRPGNEHAGPQRPARTLADPRGLPRHQWPTFIRGDCGYGNEAIMFECEERGLPYLFKLRHTAKVKELVKRMMRQGALWQDCGRRLAGTAKPPCGSAVGRRNGASSSCAKIPPCARQRGQPRRGEDRQNLCQRQGTAGTPKPPLGAAKSPCSSPRWTRAFPTIAMPKHYRDRADAENGFDELKNQWGWDGFTTQARAQPVMANLVALFYNWWNLYCASTRRHHREAIRSRPLLMRRRAANWSGGRRTVKVSVLHEKVI